mgnify:CR=1 FL=1
MTTPGLPPLFGAPWEREPTLHNEYRLAEALWAMVLEYGGDNRIDAIHPHFKQVQARAVQVLEDTGWYQAGKGFIKMR